MEEGAELGIIEFVSEGVGLGSTDGCADGTTLGCVDGWMLGWGDDGVSD